MEQKYIYNKINKLVLCYFNEFLFLKETPLLTSEGYSNNLIPMNHEQGANVKKINITYASWSNRKLR